MESCSREGHERERGHERHERDMRDMWEATGLPLRKRLSGGNGRKTIFVFVVGLFSTTMIYKFTH